MTATSSSLNFMFFFVLLYFLRSFLFIWSLLRYIHLLLLLVSFSYFKNCCFYFIVAFVVALLLIYIRIGLCCFTHSPRVGLTKTQLFAAVFEIKQLHRSNALAQTPKSLVYNALCRLFNYLCA